MSDSARDLDSETGAEVETEVGVESEEDTATEVETEVAVVGVGPGGCVLSYLLARSGVETVLLERHADLDREFRGYFFQPLAVSLFAEMGVLDDVLALSHEKIVRPELRVFGRSYEVFDLSDLPGPGYGVLMEQPPLLRLLIDRADEYDNFRFRPATGASDLLTGDEGVVGLRARDREADEELIVRSRLVVGADGRYSTVRKAAGIDPGLLESRVELVWFKLPASVVSASAQARIEAAGQLLYFGLGDEEAQLGWFVEKGTYPDLRERGIEAFRRRVAAVDPSLASALSDHLTDFEDCSLLRIEPGLSDDWTGDGLLLLGDAAHVASPVGGQGNGLAIQDAVVAHRVVTEALSRSDAATLADASDPLSEEALRAFESRRRPAVEKVLRLQRRGERGLTWLVLDGDDVPAWLKRPLLRAVFGTLPWNPFVRSAMRTFALGPDPVSVDTTRFVD
ncbi:MULTISPECIES: FAD-dependent monooxygenase [Halorussus]|uniref:FAD-dependent monooxygenase n=1 Tax=Halorussus TaxID=1070314 RepID=UPI00209C86CD|nr:FAD-dependent monooxygenase [Halorussus vallis]USZ76154.1 FAD-dependent monooxygenase [Halorussus vallis]